MGPRVRWGEGLLWRGPEPSAPDSGDACPLALRPGPQLRGRGLLSEVQAGVRAAGARRARGSGGGS